MEQVSQILSGTNLNRSSSRNCQFCNGQLEPKVIILGRPVGVSRCTCDEAVLFWVRQDEAVNAMQREQEEIQRQGRLAELFQRSMLPARWKERTFESYRVTPENEAAYERSRWYAEHFHPAADGLLFRGAVGLGKTHLAAAIAMHLLSKEHTVVFGTVTSLLGRIRSTYDDNRESERDVMRRLMRCELLIIDDMGKEKVTDWVQQTVFEIINTRYDDNKPLIITTNMTIPEIRNKYNENGEALVDRIFEMCKGVQLTGRSWRKKGLLDAAD